MKYRIMVILAFLIGLWVGKEPIYAQALRWEIPDTNVDYLDTISIPVYLLDTPSASGPVSFVSTISVSQSDLEILGIETTGTLAQNLGTVSHHIRVEANNHILTVSAAGATSLQQAGVLFRIRGVAKSSGSIQFVDDNYFDEGSPSVQTIDGNLSVTLPPNISVTPNTAELLIGDQLQFDVFGFDGPYQYDVRDASIASIDSSGLLTALAQGVTTVRARGQSRSEDWSGDITIFSLGMEIADSQVVQGSSFTLPIYWRNPNQIDVYAGDFTFEYESSHLDFDGLVTTNSLLDGKAFQVSIDSSQTTHTVQVSFASPQALGAGEILSYLQFRAVNTNVNLNTRVNILQAEANESLSIRRSDGLLQIIGSDASIFPSGPFSLRVGETIDFNTSGAVLPIKWSVSNLNVGIVRPDGLFIARSSGQCLVRAIDAIGTELTSDLISVTDAEVRIPSICAQANQTVLVPVFYETLSENTPVIAFTLTVEYDEADLTFVRTVSTDSKSDGWATLSNPTGNQVIVTAAGTQEVRGSEPLIYLEFTTSASFSHSAPISFVNCLLNEGTPSAQLIDGQVRYNNSTIDNITVGTTSSCDMQTGLYNQELTISYTNPPNSGSIEINGQSFPITGSPQTVTLQDLRANGQDVNLFAEFSSGADCGFDFPKAYTAPSCQKTILHVDSIAQGNQTGVSWHHAYTRFEDALAAAAAAPGEYEIWVAMGTYFPDSTVGRSSSFMLPADTDIYGHHAGFEIGKDQRDLTRPYYSILSGDLGMDHNPENNSYHVVRASQSTMSSLDAFTIINGNANGIGMDQHGGGILVDGALSLSEVIIKNNNSVNSGSGVYVQGTSSAHLIMHNTQLIMNTGSQGPFECALGGSTDLLENVIIE